MFESLINKFGLMLLRNVATAGGVWLVREGLLDSSQTDAFLGSVLFLGSLALSGVNTVVAHKKLKDARQ